MRYWRPCRAATRWRRRWPPVRRRRRNWSRPRAAGRPPLLVFWYRKSPRTLTPVFGMEDPNYFVLYSGRVSPEDPPPVVPGMVSVRLGPRGQLLQMHAVPLPAPANHNDPPPDFP